MADAAWVGMVEDDAVASFLGGVGHHESSSSTPPSDDGATAQQLDQHEAAGVDVFDFLSGLDASDRESDEEDPGVSGYLS